MNNYAANTQQPPAILSLYSGGGMLDEGLEKAFELLQWPKPKHAAYVEIEAFAAWNLVNKMEKNLLGPAFVFTNDQTFPAEHYYKKLCGIVGGYPCQGESLAGKQQYEKYKGYRWPYVKRIVGATIPLFCFFENVANHLNGTFPTVYRDLRKMGYHVEAGIFSAEEVGAPHKRKRLFILAVRPEFMGYTQSYNQSGYGICGCATKEQIGGSSCSMEYPIRNAECNLSGEIQTTPATPTTKQPRQNRQRLWPIPTPTGSKLEYNHGARCQKSGQTAPLSSQNSYYSDLQRPARPGQDQYEWEHLRLLKSGVELTVNGYNFREDLLRISGNGVVPPAATKAFISLMQKHKQNFGY